MLECIKEQTESNSERDEEGHKAKIREVDNMQKGLVFEICKEGKNRKFAKK